MNNFSYFYFLLSPRQTNSQQLILFPVLKLGTGLLSYIPCKQLSFFLFLISSGQRTSSLQQDLARKPLQAPLGMVRSLTLLSLNGWTRSWFLVVSPAGTPSNLPSHSTTSCLKSMISNQNTEIRKYVYFGDVTHRQKTGQGPIYCLSHRQLLFLIIHFLSKKHSLTSICV